MNLDTTNALSMIDNAYSEILKHNISESEFCDKVEKILTSILRDSFNRPDKKIGVMIVHNKKEPFFGMRCFPIIDNFEGNCLTEDSFVSPSFNGMYERWKNLKSWCIEIDSNCFNRMELNFTPSELTAMMIHEVGHVIYSDKVVERCWRALRESSVHMNTENKAAMKTLYFLYSTIFSIGALPKVNLKKADLKEERFADSTVERLGYGQYLVSAFQKIIRAYGNTQFVTENDAQKLVEREIEWATLNANDLVLRKNKLKDEIYYRMSKTSSPSLKNIYLSVMKRLGITSKNKYTGNIVTEQTIGNLMQEDFLEKNDLIYDLEKIGHWQTVISNAKRIAKDELVMESFGKQKNKKPQPPSQLDIDAISIEVDRISSHMDRRFVLDLIYDQEEKIEKFEELFEFDKSLKEKYKAKLERMKEELAGFRQQVLAKKNFEKSYKVFVKYPDGYEG